MLVKLHRDDALLALYTNHMQMKFTGAENYNA
jgi:hypothetical protein